LSAEEELAAMDKTIKIAGVQMEPKIREKSRNLDKCLNNIQSEATKGAQLIVFPEACLTGYIFHDLKEAAAEAETVPGPSTDRIIETCRRLNVLSVFGLIEEEQDKYYNSSVIVGPKGLIGKYRKLHLPFVGMDRFLNHGNLPLQVFDTDIGKIGLGICYDLEFPEHGRILSILGAEIVVVITNWPQGVEFAPEHLIHARVIENRVYYMAINRVGEERGVKFFGLSKILDPSNKILAEGKPYQEDTLRTEVTPVLARRKHIVTKAGEIETDWSRDRRPELYGIIGQPLADKSRIR
jgi:5-aminopentanamidase